MKELDTKIDADYNHRILHLLADIKEETDNFLKSTEDKCKKVYASIDTWKKVVQRRETIGG